MDQELVNLYRRGLISRDSVLSLSLIHILKVSEGPTLSMTYVSGNTSKVESMSLPRKALKPDSKVIIIDDFMRGGGTIKGMIDLRCV